MNIKYGDPLTIKKNGKVKVIKTSWWKELIRKVFKKDLCSKFIGVAAENIKKGEIGKVQIDGFIEFEGQR